MVSAIALVPPHCVAALPAPSAPGPDRTLERTSFQTGKEWTPQGDLGSDVAIVYGIDPKLPGRIETWRDHGYRIHVMTGVAWVTTS